MLGNLNINNPEISKENNEPNEVHSVIRNEIQNK